MITIPVSVGELIDKYTILQIKRSKVSADKLAKVEKEAKQLLPLVGKFIAIDSISRLYEDLIGVNLQLWNVEDEIRKLEKDKDFGDKFIELARAVYHLNDERFVVKNKINMLTDSDIQEVKQYIDYK
jgi:hypothetical protein|tara:strand:- start:2056 stop:2436 length:381 start_codon:yes stop_codon:yes gene_type:complete